MQRDCTTGRFTWHGHSVLSPCLHCGKEFNTTTYKLSHGRGKFCSQRCQYQHRSDEKAAKAKMHPLPANTEIPYGFCQCGCGHPARIADRTSVRLGHIKGEPVRFINGHNGYRPMAERFWSMVDKNGPVPQGQRELGPCWVWTGAPGVFGYGRLNLGGQNGAIVQAHRLSYELYYGPLPDDICVLHKCDNPPCVNPMHLFTGSRADNNRDMFAKGRGVVPHAKIHQRTGA